VLFLQQQQQDEDKKPKAVLVDSYASQTEMAAIQRVLQRRGFVTTIATMEVTNVASNNDSKSREECYSYQHDKATGMLKLVGSPLSSASSTSSKDSNFKAPRWIPLVEDEEHVLVQNGWSFLDPDESEPLSPFDVDAANEEGLYVPKWGEQENQQQILSKLGYDLSAWTQDQILQASATLQREQTRPVLLEGGTDVPQEKRTHNGHSFAGSVRDIPPGYFKCAIGGLPLFLTQDFFRADTASSGWLSFARPISDDHVILVQPLSSSSSSSSPSDLDQRIEVLCARTKCHLGHYFGHQGGGYCINASALDFALDTLEKSNVGNGENTAIATVAFGAGCFWHVEFALRRLRGVLETRVGFAGGVTTTTDSEVSYEEVCKGETGHAEVVKVDFDPTVLPPRVLLDCFLAMHDPAKVRAHGKHAKGMGQYRSLIVATSLELQSTAQKALEDCESQLGKELSTELILQISNNRVSADTVAEQNSDDFDWFHEAEERHQRHDEKRKLASTTTSSDQNEQNLTSAEFSSLDPVAWLEKFGTRKKAVLGSLYQS